MTTTEEIIKIIQAIPQQYMPTYNEGQICISVPYSIYFKPEDVSIQDEKGMIDLNIGKSYIHLFKDSFNALIFISK